MRKVSLTIGLVFAVLFIRGQVNLQSGSAEVNIPIHTFSDNLSRLKFNLYLNYSSGSGLLVDEIPSHLGTKWTLGDLPKIVRVQKGLPDDQKTGNNDPSGVIYNSVPSEIAGCPIILNYYPLSDKPGEVYDEAKIVSNDKAVDEFKLFLNGRLIRFYLRENIVLTNPENAVVKLNSKDPARIIPYTDQYNTLGFSDHY